jgi:RNA polymerase sigma-70 factor (ECF subfamily)
MGRDATGGLHDLYDDHAPALYRYALMILADPTAAQDAVQQVFLRVSGRGGALDGVASAAAYLRTAVRNECYSMLREKRRDRGDGAGALLEPEPTCPGDEDSRLAVEAALRELPPEQREVVHMKVYEGFTLQQIAEASGVPLNTAASRYRYALEKLRGLLAPLEDARDR